MVLKRCHVLIPVLIHFKVLESPCQSVQLAKNTTKNLCRCYGVRTFLFLCSTRQGSYSEPRIVSRSDAMHAMHASHANRPS